MIVKNSPLPAYIQIANELRHKIHIEGLPADSNLPTEEELARTYQVSRMTARAAVTQLVQEGLAYRLRGKGAFVNKTKITRPLGRLTGFYEDMLGRGGNPSSQIIFKGCVKNEQYKRKILCMDETDEVVLIKRVRLADGEPVALQSMYTSFKRLGGLLEDDIVHHSVYGLIEKKYGYRIHYTDQRMEAVNATKEISNYLRVPKNSAVFLMERVTYSTEGVPLEILESYFRGDRYSYQVRLYSIDE